MSKMMYDQFFVVVFVFWDWCNFLIVGVGLVLVVIIFGRSGVVMVKLVGQDMFNVFLEVVLVQKEILIICKFGLLEVFSMGFGCLLMVGYYGGGLCDCKVMVLFIWVVFE